VLDDIRPLRALAQYGAELLDAALKVFPAPDAYQAANIQASGTRFRGNAIFAGENRQRGAMLTYSINPDAYVPEEKGDDEAEEADDVEDVDSDDEASSDEKKSKAPDEVEIEILDASGDVIRTFKGPAKAGINRTYWSMNRKGVRGPSRTKPPEDGPEPSGPSILPGQYTARLSYGETSDETTITVHLDPRLDVNESGLRARAALYEEYEQMVTTATDLTDRIREAGEIVARVKSQLADRDDDEAKDVIKAGKAIQDSLDTYIEQFFGPTGKQGIYRNPYTVNSYLGSARSYIQSGFNMPGSTEDIAMSKAKQELDRFYDDVTGFFADNWRAYQEKVDAASIILAPSLEQIQRSY
jgi:hypothetical protein